MFCARRKKRGAQGALQGEQTGGVVVVNGLVSRVECGGGFCLSGGEVFFFRQRVE